MKDEMVNAIMAEVLKKVGAPAETAPNMIMQLQTGMADFICTDMPTAMGACATYDNLVILDFSGTDDNFEVDQGEINIGISVVKGNTFLLDAMNKVLGEMNVDMFNTIMDEDKVEDIYLYFKEDAESDSLDAAIEELGSEYSEEEIRLVRIKFISEVAN